MSHHTWILASTNEGKLAEFRHALGDFLIAKNIVLVNQSSIGLSAVAEPHDSFEANAIAKARHASAQTGFAALADDSGLCVDALGGQPGVRSARYFKDALASAAPDALRLAGYHGDEANLQLVLHRLGNQPNRSAHFVCVIAFVRHADDPDPILSTGIWDGLITQAPRGLGGFGYDPIFYDPGFQLTAAEMTISEKQSVSHRGRALRHFLKQLAGQSILQRQA